MAGTINKPHRRAKLTRREVRLIRWMHYEWNWSQRRLAKKFNVSQPTIGQIVNGDTWVDKYTCDLCHVPFFKAISDEEANQEAKEIWGVDHASTDTDMAVVCDDCWQKIQPRRRRGRGDSSK